MKLRYFLSAVAIAAMLVPTMASAYWTTGHTVTKIKVYGSGAFSIVLDGVTCPEAADGSFFVSSSLVGVDRMLELSLAAHLSGRQLVLSASDNPGASRCDVDRVQIQ